MNKTVNFWTASFGLLAAAGCALLWMNRESTKPVTSTFSQPAEPFNMAKAETNVPTIDRTTPPVPRPPGPAPRPTEAQSTLLLTRIAQSPPSVEPPAITKLQNPGESAVLSDAEGKPLLNATPTNPIFSARPSPAGQQILVSRGNGMHYIFRLNPFILVRELPLMPKDTPRASGLSPWGWIDETSLITSADIERPAAELAGLTGAERESPNNWRERSFLYSFDLASGLLSKIDTTNAGLPPSFTVVEMLSGGRLKVEWEEHGVAQTAWVAVSRK